MKVVFINCKEQPFLDRILSESKLYETRTRNTLGKLIGDRVLLAETGHGKPLVRCAATIDRIIAVYSRDEWDKYYSKYADVDSGSRYDWHDDTKVKYLYLLTDIQPVEPFCPQLGRYHGRVWAEYEGEV